MLAYAWRSTSCIHPRTWLKWRISVSASRISRVGEAHGDLVPLGAVARDDPLVRAGIAEAESVKLNLGHA
jgi:hypothetical protein